MYQPGQSQLMRMQQNPQNVQLQHGQPGTPIQIPQPGTPLSQGHGQQIRHQQMQRPGSGVNPNQMMGGNVYQQTQQIGNPRTPQMQHTGTQQQNFHPQQQAHHQQFNIVQQRINQGQPRSPMGVFQNIHTQHGMKQQIPNPASVGSISNQPRTPQNIMNPGSNAPPSNQNLNINPPSNQGINMNPSSNQGINMNPSSNQGINMNPPSNQGINMNPPSNQGVNMNPPSNQSINMNPPSNQGINMNPSSNQGMNMNPASNQGISHNVPSNQPMNISHPPNQTMSMNPSSNQSINMNPSSNQQMNMNPASNQPMNMNPASNQPMNMNPASNQPMSVNPPSNQPMSVNPPSNQPMSVNPPSNQPMSVNPGSNQQMSMGSSVNMPMNHPGSGEQIYNMTPNQGMYHTANPQMVNMMNQQKTSPNFMVQRQHPEYNNATRNEDGRDMFDIDNRIQPVYRKKAPEEGLMSQSNYPSSYEYITTDPIACIKVAILKDLRISLKNVNDTCARLVEIRLEEAKRNIEAVPTMEKENIEEDEFNDAMDDTTIMLDENMEIKSMSQECKDAHNLYVDAMNNFFVIVDRIESHINVLQEATKIQSRLDRMFNGEPKMGSDKESLSYLQYGYGYAEYMTSMKEAINNSMAQVADLLSDFRKAKIK
uniref:PAX-interacting protein 1 n=1 Tax=Strongyloides papillosus TaxID=174720 RepID=A0A0N5C7Q6_STREA